MIAITRKTRYKGNVITLKSLEYDTAKGSLWPRPRHSGTLADMYRAARSVDRQLVNDRSGVGCCSDLFLDRAGHAVEGALRLACWYDQPNASVLRVVDRFDPAAVRQFGQPPIDFCRASECGIGGNVRCP
jgi:hypothetical protein